MKRLSGWLVAFALLIAGLAPQTAQAAAPTVMVTGVVSDHGFPAAGASAMVICTDAGIGRSTKTGTDGTYAITFTTAECPLGTPVRVQSVKAGKAGLVDSTIQGTTTRIDITLTDISIPEFGWLGGALAGGVGVGAIMFARRRYAFES